MLEIQSTHRAAATPVPFLVLDENRFALAATRALQRKRFGSGRLVYVYGPPGNGKTHLARQFVAHERKTNPRIRLAHLTAAEFAAEFAQALHENTESAFHQKYRQLETLVCEDLQFLEGRWDAQKQLVFALDEILASGGRCLLTCCKAPGELVNVSRRLIDRCRGGVTAAVKPPCETARTSLIMHFAQNRQIALPEQVGQTLSRELPVSPRELFASVLQVDELSRLEHSAIDNRIVRRFLGNEVKPSAVTLEQISRAVARHFGISQSRLRAGTRARGEVFPRQCAMWLARRLTGEPLQAIARFFGRKNHATVVHACERLDRLMQSDAAVRRHIAELRRGLAQPPSRKR